VADTASLWRAWRGEVLTAPRVFCWQQPFRSRSEPDSLPAEMVAQPDRQRGVVLLHGFFCNRGFWNPWMKRLRANHVPFVAVNLEPAFGSIDAYVDTVEAAVRRVEAATGIAPVVVGHSMGGLVARAWLSRQTDRKRVHRIVTIGTPHRGTWLARFSHTLNGREMRIASPWLARLAARETRGADDEHPYQRFTCFYSNCDNIVFPASTATLPGADNRRVRIAAHVHMAFFAEVFDHVAQALR
jgi:pimeloyl-ACP methyl ester carboxylesterase